MLRSRPTTWAEYHTRRMDTVQKSSFSIAHAALFLTAALATAATFLR